MKLIGIKELEKLSPLFRGRFAAWRAELFMKLFAIDRVNQVYENSDGFMGPSFTCRLLADLGVNYEIGNPANLKNLPEGAFITVSNHPYGGLDGVILIDLMGRIRSDYRLMVNSMLSMVKTLRDNFITVTPAGNGKKEITGKSLSGIRETMKHLGEGHPAGFFPSGAVSDFSLRDLRIRDRKWQESVIHLIRHVRVPVLPLRFFDHNSAFFYFLGLINWRVRSLRLPYELFNKKESKTRLGIGQLITLEQQRQFKDNHSFGLFLRKAVYEMPMPGSFLPSNMLNEQFTHNYDLTMAARIS